MIVYSIATKGTTEIKSDTLFVYDDFEFAVMSAVNHERVDNPKVILKIDADVFSENPDTREKYVESGKILEEIPITLTPENAVLIAVESTLLVCPEPSFVSGAKRYISGEDRSQLLVSMLYTIMHDKSEDERQNKVWEDKIGIRPETPFISIASLCSQAMLNLVGHGDTEMAMKRAGWTISMLLNKSPESKKAIIKIIKKYL